MKRVGVIGSGVVGRTLASGFLHHGYEVTIGTREPQKLAEWVASTGGRGRVAGVAATAEQAEIVVLAVRGLAAEQAVALAGPERLAGKTVFDATNPIAEGSPEHGVLRLFTGHEESLMERLQKTAPQARFVKAWSCAGSALMVDPQLPGGPPTMFICGDDPGAKREAVTILEQFGWEVEDLGGVEAARAIEPLCILLCIPGFLRNDWRHAFKMLR
ncbi:MAG: DNA-binding protein [Thermoanaerobaculia bacterium]|nr:MAG: DNA-binding protein [Thermoanaerobaculia bacterium]MBZ0101019.1 NAD(P)-binding domain-containing protein [Thermoanaerobaculia bacterium]